jgi:hypothetical protein
LIALASVSSSVRPWEDVSHAIQAIGQDELGDLGAVPWGDNLRPRARLWGATKDEARRIEPGFPHDFGGARLAYGETFELIDDQRGLIDPLV